MKGLENQIPDLQERANHIFKNQIFGIAITELTSLLSRRTIYGSKTANGRYSFCTEFDDEKGNIVFDKINHTWQNGKCVFCGASQEVHDRDKSLETYAYQFIHTENPEEIFNMKFDVIIGNPPYQLSSNDDGIQAVPLYDKFVNQAKKLNPRYLVMIIPARWYSGGMGMNSFRKEMLHDTRIKILCDFPKSRDCFPGVDVAGGICYFLWDRDYNGNCTVISSIGKKINQTQRALDEFNIFIRDNLGIKIIHKVLDSREENLSKFVYPISPFGISTKTRGYDKKFKNCITLISSNGKSYVDKTVLTKNKELIDFYKVSIGQLNPDRGGVNNAKDGKMNVITKVKIYEPNEVFTATYLLLGAFKEKKKAENFTSFIKTKFTRFLISLTLSSMHITKDNFQFVPMQDFSSNLDIDWSKPIPEIDKQLYKKYGLTQEEIDFIESMIRPME